MGKLSTCCMINGLYEYLHWDSWLPGQKKISLSVILALGGRDKKILGVSLGSQCSQSKIQDQSVTLSQKNEADSSAGAGFTMFHDLYIMTSCFL